MRRWVSGLAVASAWLLGACGGAAPDAQAPASGGGPGDTTVTTSAPAGASATPARPTRPPPAPSTPGESGGAGDGTPAPTTGPPPTQGGGQRVVHVDGIAGGIAGFVTPSGNITCMLLLDRPTAQVRCDIAHADWSLPRPDSCGLDYGHAFILTTRAEIGCVGDTVEGAGEVDQPPTAWRDEGIDPIVPTRSGDAVALPYGSSMAASDLRCTSRRTGLTCANTRTGAGFTLARGDYSITPAKRDSGAGATGSPDADAA